MKSNRIALFILCTASVSCAYPNAKVTIRAVDIHGQPISEAEAMVVFHQNLDPGTGVGWKSVAEEGATDASGRFTGHGEGHYKVFAIAKKQGYYRSGKELKYTERDRVRNRWLPWNQEVELRLKPIVKPVPMILYLAGTFSVPEYGKSLGYDLKHGDWVAPHGKGETNDVIMQVERRFVEWDDHDVVVKVSFPNDGDGIQPYKFDPDEESEFKWPYKAPLEGYTNAIVWERHAKGGRIETDYEKSNYILRVRTRKDRDGKIVSGNYVKLLNGLNPGWGSSLYSEYWFNPDPKSRGLEDDPKRNAWLRK